MLLLGDEVREAGRRAVGARDDFGELLVLGQHRADEGPPRLVDADGPRQRSGDARPFVVVGVAALAGGVCALAVAAELARVGVLVAALVEGIFEGLENVRLGDGGGAAADGDEGGHLGDVAEHGAFLLLLVFFVFRKKRRRKGEKVSFFSLFFLQPQPTFQKRKKTNEKREKQKTLNSPVNPAVDLAILFRSTPFSTRLFLQCTARMSARPCTSGSGTTTMRSNRPGRVSAESSAAGRLVAAMTMTPVLSSKPSISVRSWLIVWTASVVLIIMMMISKEEEERRGARCEEVLKGMKNKGSEREKRKERKKRWEKTKKAKEARIKKFNHYCLSLSSTPPSRFKGGG